MEDEGQLIGQLVLFLGTGGMLLLTTAITLFIFLYQRKLIKRKMAFQEIEDLLKKQELDSAYLVLKAQDQERKRIAEELHDNVGSILVTLNMYTDTLISKGIPDEQREIAERITNVVNHASAETRKLAHNLHSGSLKHFGLETALKELIHAVTQAKAIRFEHHLDLNIELQNETVMNIYRIIQELINNTLKHANASKIRLEIIEINGSYINLIYEDNGTGFSGDKKRGIGLKNIYSRVDRMNGEISIDSVKGTTVIIEIPIDEEN